MSHNVPAWAKDLTPSPLVVAETKPISLAPVRNDAERIADARARAIARTQEMNPVGGWKSLYGWQYPPSHYQDFSGPETSAWDTAVLVCIAGILESPILKRSKFFWQSEHYDARTAQFNLCDTSPVSIQGLKEAVQNRIDELGLSLAAIWEWYADVREPIGREWWREDLETRIQKFKR